MLARTFHQPVVDQVTSPPPEVVERRIFVPSPWREPVRPAQVELTPRLEKSIDRFYELLCVRDVLEYVGADPKIVFFDVDCAEFCIAVLGQQPALLVSEGYPAAFLHQFATYHPVTAAQVKDRDIAVEPDADFFQPANCILRLHPVEALIVTVPHIPVCELVYDHMRSVRFYCPTILSERRGLPASVHDSGVVVST